MSHVVQFIPNTARKPQGLGHPGIEQFRDNPYVSCARETGQNTNDAPDDGKRPVRMSFDLRAVPRGDLPMADELQAHVAACLEQSRAKCDRLGEDPEKDRTVRFFERANDSLSEEFIQVLEVADYNTTGLTGPFDDENSVFNSLVKADGVTNKPQADSGGSFGIGKNAAFAVSDVQTVIYSTRAKNSVDPEGPDIFGCQARLQLISHEKDGLSHSAEGYWGNEDFYAIKDTNELPPWMVREERGTSIFALCFREHESWAERMALSILTNFLVSVMRGDMEFEIDDGRIKINKSTLITLLENPAFAEVAKISNQTVALERARDMHNCLTSGAGIKHTMEVKGFGKVDFYILVAEGLPRRVNFIRNGMFVTDNLENFGFPMSSFPGTKEFIAILEPSNGKKGKPFGELLKRMENPEHNNFSPERLRDDEERTRVMDAIRKLHRDVRDTIRSEAKVAESDQSNLDELARLFAADPEEGEESAGEEKDPERYELGKAKVKKKKPVVVDQNEGDDGGAGGSGESGGGGGGGEGDGDGSGEGGSGTRGKKKPFRLSRLRTLREPSGGEYSNRIFFTPEESGSASIQVYASGLTNVVQLEPESSERGKINKSDIELDLTKGERQSIGVKFLESYDGPVEIKAYALILETQK